MICMALTHCLHSRSEADGLLLQWRRHALDVPGLSPQDVASRFQWPVVPRDVPPDSMVVTG